MILEILAFTFVNHNDVKSSPHRMTDLVYDFSEV